MNILICIDKDEFFTPAFLDAILSKNKNDNILIGITFQKITFKKNIKNIIWKVYFFKIYGVIKLVFIILI